MSTGPGNEVTGCHSVWGVHFAGVGKDRSRHTLVGTVCGLPILFPQYPLLMGTTDIFARIMAPRMAVATCRSLAQPVLPA